MESSDDKAFVMMLLREADEKSLKIEALSLITECCTSTDDIDWHEIRDELQDLLDTSDSTPSGTPDNPGTREITYGESVGFPG